MDTLGQQVKARRRSLSLLQSDVADLAQVSERFVREVEHDKPTLRLDKLSDVLAVLGLRLTTELRPGEPR
jgi:HTH-type transcriptional regulator / antitoxin HipB